MTSVIPGSRVVQITAQLQGTALAVGNLTTGSGRADTSGLVTFMRMILPAGVTYTSTSGVFLTGSGSAAWRQQYFGTPENSGPGADCRS